MHRLFKCAFVLVLWVCFSTGCDLSPDIRCESNQTCQSENSGLGCFKGRCYPKTWIEKVKKFKEKQDDCRYCPFEGDVCVDINQDDNHCGECKKACGQGRYCIDKKCRCSDGLSFCDGKCTSTQSSAKHCGGCGNACRPGTQCYKGKCSPLSCDQHPVPLKTCGKSCVDLLRNPAHCGSCNKLCSPDKYCIKGKCACGPSQKVCDGRCTDLDVDSKHCGKCGNACAKGQVCAAGKCLSQCPSPTATVCFGGCFDLPSSPRHCGGCGQRCLFGQSCVDSQCSDEPPSETSPEKPSPEPVQEPISDGGSPEGERRIEKPTEPTCVPKPKKCNGEDDDCNGKIDEGCACKAGDTKPCGVTKGECKAGTLTCDANGKWGSCIGEVKAKPEECNGKDDDCDGDFDENLTQQCYTGKGTPGKGICKHGSQKCNAGKWGTCVGQIIAQASESCNGKDDDCDGLVDNNPKGAPACDKIDGACAGATASCLNGSWAKCTPADYRRNNTDYQTNELKCDGKDNDCDGQIDENLTSKLPCPKTKGVCAGAVQQCISGKWQCTKATYTAKSKLYEEKETSCDGNDNDCDGVVDYLCVYDVAGTCGVSGTKNGALGTAQFKDPVGIVVNPQGTIFIADNNNNAIRKIDLKTKIVSTFAGKIGSNTFKDGQGQQAIFSLPQGMSRDTSTGTIYVADLFNYRIRAMTGGGLVSSPYGSSTAGYSNGKGTLAQFKSPKGVFAHKGDVYITDENRIRKIDFSGQVTTLAGSKQKGFKNANGTSALFNGPIDLAVSSKGEIFVAEFFSNRIRKVDTKNEVTTFAGSGTAGVIDGSTTKAQFYYPLSITIDSKDNLYVGEFGAVRLITPSGVTTLAGSKSNGYQKGFSKQAKFNQVTGLAFDATGNLIIVDGGNHCIRKLILK